MLFPKHPIPEGLLRHSFVSPSRKEGPPSIWDTHGISGNVFADPVASSAAPYHPTERLRGRGVQRPVYEPGKKVLFLPLAPARRGDFGARFDYGIYLGCRSFDGQAYVGTPSGMIRCRTVRQLSAQ